MADIPKEARNFAIMELNDHCRSVISAIDQYLIDLREMDKAQFIEHLKSERRHFKSRIGENRRTSHANRRRNTE